MLKAIFGQYEAYWIYQCAGVLESGRHESLVFAPILDPVVFSQCDDDSLIALAGYGGSEARGFGAFENGRLVAGCWFWFGERYKSRNFWPLSEGDAKLVQISTGKAWRGRGVGPALIKYASAEMARRGFDRLFARVWVTHSASRSAFRKAGWRKAALVVSLRPFRRLQRVRLVVRLPRFLRFLTDSAVPLFH